MEPTRIPIKTDSDAAPSGQPGQVVGPAATAPPSVIEAEIPAAPIAPAPELPVVEPARPTTVASPTLPTEGIILPPSAAPTGGLVTPSVFGEPSVGKGSKMPKFRLPKGKKALLGLIALPVLLIGGSAAAYFGYVVPNQPDNVWAKALSNSGKAYDKLSDYTQKELTSGGKGVVETGSFKTTGQFVSDGTFNGSSDGQNGEFTGNLSTSGLKVNLDVRSIKSTGDAPDIYFKVDGLQGVGSLLGDDPDIQNSINAVNNNWYFVDHSLLDQYTNNSTASSFKATDVKSILDAIGTASQQNVFTTDPTKMAFVVKQKIGKEKVDGRNTYHFKVGVNNNNLSAYEKALCDNLKNSSLKKFFNNSSADTASAFDCSDTSSTFKDSDTADVWVDMHTKLIHKIRFTNPDNSQEYVEVSQDYQGGDEIPFSLSVYDKEDGSVTTASLDVTLNMKTNKLTMAGNYKQTGDDAITGSLNITLSPNNSTVNVEKPTNAKNVAQLVNDLDLNALFGGADSLDLNSSGNNTSADTERKVNIDLVHSQIEAYGAENGYYPTLVELNDATWRAKNMPDVDPATLADPDSTSSVLVANPTAGAYAYTTVPANCTSKCTSYTLTATLSDGSTYVKKGLNDDGNTTILN